MRLSLIARVSLLTSLCVLSTAHAQATRTWVSGVGDDANPCSRTQPCKTFAGAIGKTAAAGEIDALDPGSYGAVTITKAITIDGHQTLDATTAVGSSGITITAGVTDAVILRGLSLRGDGTQSGVLFTSGGTLQIEDCSIARFKDGVRFEPAAGGQLFLLKVASRHNANAGVLVRSGGAARSFATLSQAHLEDNAVGLLAGAGARVNVYDSVASGNSGAGVSAALDGAGGTAEINLESVAVSHNGVGVSSTASAGTAIVRMSQVLGTGNTTAPTVATGNGAVLSFGNNRLDVPASLALSSAAPSQSVTRGTPASFPLAVTVTGLLSGPISFACTDLPAGADCRFDPNALGVAGGAVTLTVATSATTMGLHYDGSRTRGQIAVLALFLLLALSMSLALLVRTRTGRLRRPLAGAAGAGIILAMALLYVGCSDSQTTEPPPGPAGGTYPFQVTAISGSVTATLPLTLIVN